MSFLQFSAVSWVQWCLSTHQSHGNNEDTQVVHELEVVKIMNKNKVIANESTPEGVAVKECEICRGKIWTLLAFTD